MIKKIIAYIPCNIFFYLGDAVSKVLNLIPNDEKFEPIAHMVYSIYNGLMLYSAWWNDFGGLSVWEKIDETH